MAKQDGLPETVVLPIDVCQPVDWNPNVEDLGTFNDLVENIKKVGFLEPIVVAPNPDGETYAVVGGEHRWKAAKLAGLSEVTAVVVDWDEDMQKIQTVKLNVIRGKFDPRKFAALWNDLEKKYGHEATLRLVGMASKEKEVARLLAQVKRGLPPSLREEVEKRADKIRNVEDLATVIQSLYARHGATLDHSYMFFNFGGRTHLMVKLQPETLEHLRGALQAMAERGRDANELVERALHLASQEEASPRK